MGRKCICEICLCGRHRCPHRAKSTILKNHGPCMLTEYANKYKSYPGAGMRESFKPNQQMLQGGEPMSDATTQRLDYIPHDAQRPAPHVPDGYRKPDGDFDLLTSYTKDYPARKADMPKSFRGTHTNHVPTGEFRGHPTYTDDYRKWDLAPRDAPKPQNAYIPPNAAFDGVSTFTRDYAPKRAEMRPNMKPSNSAYQSQDPLDDKTSHRLDYIPHQAQARYVPPKEAYKRNKHPFDSMTTFRRDFTGTNAPRSDSFKPPVDALHSDTPFDDNTTFKTDYRPWEGQRPQPHVPESWSKPAGEMDLATTSKIAYPPHQIRPPSHKRPKTTGRMTEAPFDDRTHYSQDFRQWSSVPERRGDPTQKPYQRPDLPFEGTTNYRSHYIPKQAPPVRSLGPDRTANLSSEPFDDRTMYKTEYIPKENALCPAINLSNAGYEFTMLDQRGHEIWAMREAQRRSAGSSRAASAIGMRTGSGSMQRTPTQQLSMEQATLA
ncbi:stabilizer of axonemal microtubules 2-like isoform X2 [Amphiura filiformis]|uniref:stabilizer of axonemal microtubules 2-like isoform X2 n=1 Tax=Amphiura filiformis TaxID=82378 RepID=UPI003B20C138